MPGKACVSWRLFAHSDGLTQALDKWTPLWGFRDKPRERICLVYLGREAYFPHPALRKRQAFKEALCRVGTIGSWWSPGLSACKSCANPDLWLCTCSGCLARSPGNGRIPGESPTLGILVAPKREKVAGSLKVSPSQRTDLGKPGPAGSSH